MKKLAIYLSIAFVLILCTFGAGCVSTTDPHSSVSSVFEISGTIDQESQKMYEDCLNLYNSRSEGLIIHTDEFLGYEFHGTEWTSLSIYSINRDANILIKLKSSETSNIENGVHLDSSIGQELFIIKDPSLEKSYLVAIDDVRNPDYSRYDAINFAYLTPTDYEFILTDLKEFFEDKYKDKRKVAQSEFDYYQNIYNMKPGDYEIITGELESYKMNLAYDYFDVRAGEASLCRSLNSEETYPIKDGVMLDEYWQGAYNAAIFLVKDASLTQSYMVEFQTVVDYKYNYGVSKYPGTYSVAYILYLSPEDYAGILAAVESHFE